MSKPLDPADPARCQGEHREWNPFGFGSPYLWQRCTKKPVVIATEVDPGGDGQVGSMSLCRTCKAEFEKKMGSGFATYKRVPKQPTNAKLSEVAL